MKDKTVLSWIIKRAACRVPMLLGVIVANTGVALFGVLFAVGSRGIIDAAVAANSREFFGACALQVVVICGLLICLTANRYLTDRLSTELDRDRKRQLLGSLLRADYAEAADFHSGELINRLNNDVRQLNDGIVGILPSLISMVVRLGAAVWVLAATVPGLTVILLVAGGGLLVGTGMLRPKMKQYQHAVSRSEGRVLAFMQEAAERLLVIQSMGLGGEIERRSDKLLAERAKAQADRRTLSVTANSAVGILYYLAGFLALVWCASELLHGQMSFGTLTLVTQLVGQLQAPFVNLSGILPRYTAMCAAGERLMEMEALRCVQPEISERQDIPVNMTGVLVAEELCFSYGKEEVFSKATFRIPLGSFTTISGPSGAGKSTLLKLLLSVYRPDSGRLLLENNGVQNDLQQFSRGMFAYVPQGNLLFSGTIRENILLARPQATPEELEQAVHVSGVDLFLNQLPRGLDTVLGENGEGLSEGQAQRLAIARAIICGAPIFLLDEATSALDSATERVVLSRLARLSGRTCIAVTHRPAALEIADQQLEVREGMVLVRVCKS